MQVSITIPAWASHVISDLTDMERRPQPVNAKTVSSFKLKLPDDCYFEYAFVEAQSDPLNHGSINLKRLRADPQNPLKADNPWYLGISAIRGPEYKADPLANPVVKAAGILQRFKLESSELAETRRIVSYTPATYATVALPVIYIQDGLAYYRIARLADVLEELLQKEKLAPAHLVFVEPNDRFKEYRYNPAYQAFMVKELLPFITAKLKTTARRIAMGASLGGLMSSILALEYPDVFQTVVSQSGAFLGSPEDPDFYKSKSSWVLERLQKQDTLPVSWYIDTGSLEWLYDINKQVAEVLQAKNYVYRYAQRAAGHNWVNWRNGLADALRFVLSQELPDS